MATPTMRIPGVYQRPRPRKPEFPRVRTDVVGFVGVAGPERLHELVRLDDWRDYEEIFLLGRAPPLGSRLAEAVRAYFANGGARCWVVNVAEQIRLPGSPPTFLQPENLLALLLGLPDGPGPLPQDPDGRLLRAWGLELLLQQPEVAMVAVPDLHAARVEPSSRRVELPPRFEQGVFGPCGLSSGGAEEVPGDDTVLGPLLSTEQVLLGSRVLAERCERDKTRVFALLSPPDHLDPTQVLSFRRELGRLEASALYWPWLMVQDAPGLPVYRRDPVGAVSGVYAQRDLAAGPHRSPANVELQGVVGTAFPVDDSVQAEIYDEGINPLRVFPRRGVTLWGARTLAFVDPELDVAEPLSYVSARRGLTAIERTADSIGQTLVFEPLSPILWLRTAQAMAGYMQTLLRDGVLMGSTTAEAYFVRCDSTVNPPDQVALGRLVCEVGVALAVPAEFVVFRLGRREGVVEIEEV
jgi:hypothetical protein